MRALRFAGPVMVLVSALGATAFGTQAHQYSSPTALALVAAFGSFLGTALIVGLPRERAQGTAEWLVPALAGAGGFALAPWLVMVNRYTDAPPGSEVTFFSVVAWGAMLALVLALRSNDRVRRGGGTVLALAAAAAVLANWERPSSFSPLVRYAREEAFMLLAGVLWVTLVLLLLRAAEQGSLGRTAFRASLGGVVGAFALAAPALASAALTAEDFITPGLWAYGIATAFLTAGVLMVLRTRAATPIAGALMLVPSSMSLLLLLEGVFGYRGPNPLLVGPILAATVAALSGIVLASGVRHGSGEAKPRHDRWLTFARGLAAIAIAAAAVSLALPGTTATVSATRADGSGFEAAFELYGFEMVGPWLALGLTCGALGIVLRPALARARMAHAAAVVAAAAAWPFVAGTPIRTLTSFIPSDVQVDYGSEFARIDFSGGPSVLAAIALGGALVAVAVTLSQRTAAVSAGPEEASQDPQEVNES